MISFQETDQNGEVDHTLAVVYGGGGVNQVFWAGEGSLIIEFPYLVDASNGILEKFSVTPNTRNTREVFTYDTTLFDECERKYIEYFSNHKDVKIGLTSTIMGNITKALE